MIDFDPSKLRALVIHDYVTLAHGITDAAEMNTFTEAVMSTAVRAVRDQLHVFNHQSVAARLPAKVLAACFRHLPFRFCISPSHVCRSWRAAALSEPAIWSQINHRAPLNGPELLQMALSRAGALPVNLNVDSQPRVDPDAIYVAIEPFSRQLRHIMWHSEPPSGSWEFPSPIMEVFCCTRTITITSNFLGGHVGRLRCLYLQGVYLPPVCPAISTVTDLSVLLTPDDAGAPPSTLGNVFKLFPRLEWLQILKITSAASEMLPSGPPPTCLTELVLGTSSWDYDLTPHYLAWGARNLRSVSLSQHADPIASLELLSTGTITLGVKYSIDNRDTRFMFEHSDTVSHSVSVNNLGIAAAATLLAAVQPALNHVRTVKVSHTALEPLASLLLALPALELLFVHITLGYQYTYRNTTHVFPYEFGWDALSCLPDLARRLRSVTLQVGCPRWFQLHPTRAEELLAKLRGFGAHGDLPPIVIQGFSAAVVSSVDVAELNVQFDVVTAVGDLVLRRGRKIYYPYQPEW